MPAASVARTERVCAPRRSFLVKGEVQGEKGLPSRLQAKVEPASLEEKVNVTRAFFLRVLTLRLPETAVSGAVVSGTVVSGTAQLSGFVANS